MSSMPCVTQQTSKNGGVVPPGSQSLGRGGVLAPVVGARGLP